MLGKLESSMNDKRSKFVQLATKRVNRAIKDIRLIGNLSNRSAYEFSEADARKIVKAIRKEVDTMRQRFSGKTESVEQPFKL
jgi:hypothetical protein